MSKRKTPVQAATVSPTVVHATQMGTPYTNPNLAPPVQLDLRVTTESLVKVAMVERQEELLTSREALEKRYQQAMTTYRDAETQLQAQATKLAESYKFDASINPLLEALQGFTGKVHVVKLFGNEWYRYNSNAESIHPSIDLAQKKIIGKVLVFERRADDNYKTDAVLEKDIQIDFSADMLETVKQIELFAKDVKTAEEALTEIKRKLADLPRLKDRAEAELTKAYLRGELTNGAALLETLLKTQSKALPAAGYHA